MVFTGDANAHRGRNYASGNEIQKYGGDGGGAYFC